MTTPTMAMVVYWREIGLRAFADRAGDLLPISLRASSASPQPQHLHPFAGFEVLVVLEEVLDLLQRDLGRSL
jgi:hypothetical protein